MSKLKNSSEDHSAVMDELAELMQARHNLVIAKVEQDHLEWMQTFIADYYAQTTIRKKLKLYVRK